MIASVRSLALGSGRARARARRGGGAALTAVAAPQRRCLGRSCCPAVAHAPARRHGGRLFAGLLGKGKGVRAEADPMTFTTGGVPHIFSLGVGCGCTEPFGGSRKGGNSEKCRAAHGGRGERALFLPVWVGDTGAAGRAGVGRPGFLTVSGPGRLRGNAAQECRSAAAPPGDSVALDGKGRRAQQKAGHLSVRCPCLAGPPRATASGRGGRLLFFFLPEIELRGDKRRARVKGAALQVARVVTGLPLIVNSHQLRRWIVETRKPRLKCPEALPCP